MLKPGSHSAHQRQIKTKGVGITTKLTERIFTIADALICGQPVAVSSCGGGNSDSDLRWDGRRQDEEEEAYRRRCLMFAVVTVCKQQTKSYRRK